MKGLETGKNKIQKICDALKKETLEPAKQEAREIVENAHMQASEIVQEAKEKAASLLQEAEKTREEKARVFKASLELAARQGVEALKQKIEKELFQKELASLVSDEMKDPKLIANLINALVDAVEKEGLEEDLSALIPKKISKQVINELLAKRVLEKLEEETVVAADFAGGAKVQLKNRQMTLDVSDALVKELISRYIRQDLRDFIFAV